MLYYGFTVLLAVTVNIFMLLHAVHMFVDLYIKGAVLLCIMELC